MKLEEYITRVLSAVNGVETDSITFEVFLDDMARVSALGASKIILTIDVSKK